MEEVLDDIILSDFERITGYDVRDYISSYLSFVDSDYGFIVNFFTGSSNVNPTVSFNNLKKLIKRSIRIQDLIALNANSLKDYRFWILGEYLDDIFHQLETTSNFSKWARSSSTGSGYKSDLRTDVLLKQGQTLQDLERDDLKNNDPDGWVETALQNSFEEEDYDLGGGQLLKVIFKNNESISMQGVVDNIDDPIKTYGIDVDSEIDFENNDLKMLSYKETLFQSIDILCKLAYGDDPSFPERGIRMKGALGGNIAAISYPSIFRDMALNFATDDCFKAMSVTDVKREQDAVFIDFKVETKAGDLLNKSAQI